MPYYLLQLAETPQGWEATMKLDLEQRVQTLGGIVEKLGGKIEGCWGAFGEYDWVLICQMPDNINAAAFAIAMSGGGAIRAFKTTPLMTLKETAAALKKAATCGYKPPK
jgi:uncharacterized protein with GYD domain